MTDLETESDVDGSYPLASSLVRRGWLLADRKQRRQAEPRVK